jgi:hypothetical protein
MKLVRRLLKYNDFASRCFYKDDDSATEYTARFHLSALVGALIRGLAPIGRRYLVKHLSRKLPLAFSSRMSATESRLTVMKYLINSSANSVTIIRPEFLTARWVIEEVA